MGIAFHPSSKSTRERCPSRTVCIHTHAPLRYRSSTSTRFRRVRTAATSAHTRCACKKAHQRQVCTFRLQGNEGLVLTRLRGVIKKHQDLTDAKHQVSVKVRSLPSQPSKVFNAQHLGWQAQHSAQGAQWHAQSHTTSQVSQPCCWLVAPEPRRSSRCRLRVRGSPSTPHCRQGQPEKRGAASHCLGFPGHKDAAQ